MAGPGDGMSEEESEGLDVEARGWGGHSQRGRETWSRPRRGQVGESMRWVLGHL